MGLSSGPNESTCVHHVGRWRVAVEQEGDCGAAEHHGERIKERSISWRPALWAGMIELLPLLRLCMGAFRLRRCLRCSPSAHGHATPCYRHDAQQQARFETVSNILL